MKCIIVGHGKGLSLSNFLPEAIYYLVDVELPAKVQVKEIPAKVQVKFSFRLLAYR